MLVILRPLHPCLVPLIFTADESTDESEEEDNQSENQETTDQPECQNTSNLPEQNEEIDQSKNEGNNNQSKLTNKANEKTETGGSVSGSQSAATERKPARHIPVNRTDKIQVCMCISSNVVCAICKD